MPKPLSEHSKREVVNNYVKGQSYRDVSESSGVSLGAVSSIIGEAKKIYPDLEELRELRSKLPQDVDISALNKSVSSALEAEKQLGIPIEKILEFIENRRKEIDELSEQKASLGKGVSELSSQSEFLQSEVKELSDKKDDLGKDIVEYEEAKRHLSEYGISLVDVDRLRSLLDNVNRYALDPEKCVSAIQQHEMMFKEIESMRRELDELTMWKNTLQWSLSSLENQHTQKGLQLHLKKEAVVKREQDIQELDKYTSQLKGELDKLEEKKLSIVSEIALETEKRGKLLEAYRAEKERVTEAYTTEREGLKRKVEALKIQLLELEKSIADRYELVKTLNEEIERLRKSIEHYDQSKTIKEIQAELDVAQLRFFSLAYKAVERGDAVLAKNTVDDISKRITAIEEKIGIKRQGNIVTLRT